jgi:zinc and cadmium transporter
MTLMDALIYSIIATGIVSLLSFIGVVALALKEKTLNKIILVLVAFAAGALLGGAFFHLLPEALDISLDLNIFVSLLIGFCMFFVLEKALYWRHCHEGKCKVHVFTYLSLIGGGIHNFIDGLVIVSAFVVNTAVGIATTLAVISHELPQELGDFGTLVYGGFTKKKALVYNFLSAVLAVFGAVVGYFVASQITDFALYLLPFAAGGFIYIASSDLIPELHKETDKKRSLISFAFFLVGLAVMYLTKILLS